MFIAQTLHLASFNEPFFLEDFEAWVHGPVIPSVFDHFKTFSFKPILLELGPPCISLSAESFLNEVLNQFFHYSSEELKHLPIIQKPWSSARKGLRRDSPSNRIISYELIKSFFVGN